MSAGNVTDLVTPLPGFRAYTTPRGIRVTELHWSIHPEHGEGWKMAEKALYTEKDWRREQELDWSTPAGDAFLPEFNDLGGRAVFEFLMTDMIAAPVFRGFDFGRRRPACVWFQYSPKDDRVWVIREFMPHDLGTHEFRDAVRFLSNQAGPDILTPRARMWIEHYAAKPSGQHAPPPWFPLGTQFIDLGGKEALQTQANASTEDAVARQIFSAGGIDLIIVNPSVEGRYAILRRLLKLYPDGYPGLLIDPQCAEVEEGFEGGLSYPEPTEANPIPTKPKKDGHFENLFDAFGYGIAGVVPKDAPLPAQKPRVIGYRGRQEIMAPAQDEVIPWREHRYTR